MRWVIKSRCRVAVDQGFEALDHGIRGTAEEEAAKLSERNARQRALVAKHKVGITSVSLRPRKEFRTSSKRWCMILDQQLQSTSAGARKLSHFKMDGTRKNFNELWANPLRSPHLAITSDQGSDNTCGVHALMYKFGLAVEWWPDQCHRACNDLSLALSDCGAKPLWIKMLIDYNCPFGPRRGEDLWLHKMRSFMEHLYMDDRGYQQPLFLEHAHNIVTCLRQNGDLVPGSADLNRAAWEFMSTRGLFGRSGRRASMGRFMASVAANEYLHKYWAIDLFEVVAFAQEHGWLTKKVLDIPATAEHVDPGTTGTSVPSIDEVATRKDARNAVLMRLKLHMDGSARRYLQAALPAGHLVKVFHERYSKACRGSYTTYEWHVDMAHGGMMEHVTSFVRALSNSSQNETAGFAVSLQACKAVAEDIVSEDEFASFYFQLCMSMACHRLRSGLSFIMGYPKSLMRACPHPLRPDDPAHAPGKVLKLFSRDRDDHIMIKQSTTATTQCLKVQARSLFERTVVKEWIRACVDENWEATIPLMAMARKQFSGVSSTLYCEEMIGVMKNNPAGMSEIRARRPVAALCAALSSNLGERHRWKRIPEDRPLPRKRLKVSADHFKSSVDRQSLPFETMCGPNPSPNWFSPRAQDANVPCADLVLNRHFLQHHDVAVFDEAHLAGWMGVHCKVAIQLSTTMEDAKWLIPLGSFPESAGIAWPATEKLLPTTGITVLQLDPHVEEPPLVPFYGVKQWRAVQFEPKSIAWQRMNMGPMAAMVSPAVRLLKVGAPDTLFKVMCRNAFWALKHSEVIALALDYDDTMPIPKSKPLFDVLFFVIQHTLKTTTEETLLILMQRKFKEQAQREAMLHLSTIDEAADVMEWGDLQKLWAEKKAAKKDIDEDAEFETALKDKRVALERERAAAEAADPAKGKGKSKGKGKGKGPGIRLAATIEQSTAKFFLPPNTSVWRGLTRGEWCGHAPPFKRIFERWSDSTERNAMIRVIKRLWQQYAELNQKKFPDCCPWMDRLTEDPM